MDQLAVPDRRSVVAKVRLPRPDIEGPGSRLDEISEQYATGSPRFAAHLLAIMARFSARDLNRILRAAGPR